MAAEAIFARVNVLEALMKSLKVSEPAGVERNLAKIALDMEIFVSNLTQDTSILQASVNATIEKKMKSEVEGIIDNKLRTAIQFSKGSS